MNRYWMEDSFGKLRRRAGAVRPVPAAGEVATSTTSRSFQNTTRTARTRRARRRRRRRATRTTPTPRCDAAWRQRRSATADERRRSTTCSTSSAGQDESATWQEFGEMRFTGPETVTDAFGPKAIDPLHARGNWATTRYIPWTSWAAAANIWPSAAGNSSTEAESSGMAVYAHELSHNLASRTTTTTRSRAPPQRTAGGMWDMMSRGSFNGPGGQHTRWQIPPTQGARARRAARPAQQALPELHRRRRHPAPQPRRAGADRHRRGRGQGARGRAGRRPRRRARRCSTARAT